MAKKAVDKKVLKYDEAIKEVEAIIASITAGDIDIDKLPLEVKRGAELIAYCRERLKSSEASVNELLADKII